MGLDNSRRSVPPSRMPVPRRAAGLGGLRRHGADLHRPHHYRWAAPLLWSQAGEGCAKSRLFCPPRALNLVTNGGKDQGRVKELPPYCLAKKPAPEGLRKGGNHQVPQYITDVHSAVMTMASRAENADRH